MDDERTALRDPEAPVVGTPAGIPPWAKRLLGGLVALLVVLVLVLAGLKLLLDHNERRTEETTRGAIEEVGQQAGLASWPDAKKALDAQAAALLRGDEEGWLAAVDPDRPDLRETYRQLYANLRALRVSGWSYHEHVEAIPKYGTTELLTTVRVAACFSVSPCPGYDRDELTERQGMQILDQKLWMARRGDAYVITTLQPPESGAAALPPWHGERLSFAQGKRVTLAAAAEAPRLESAVAVADRAAAVADRYAKLLDNEQRRYRVYLADDAEWKRWYGSPPRPSAAGYALMRGTAHTDVVVKMSVIESDADLLHILRHELGHVATLNGSDQVASAIYDSDEWLTEGTAEYIGHVPRGARANPSFAAVREGERPGSVVAAPLQETSEPEEIARLYGLGHHAVGCMVDRYGERRFFAFFRRAVREGSTYDEASRKAFGVPFARVDRACVASIR